MSFLVRKVSRAKWQQNPDLGADEIQADAVTIDLKTTGNTLSFWRSSSANIDDLQQAALAILAKADRPDRHDFIYIEESRLHDGGLTLKPTAGDTPVASLRETHVDIEKLDLRRLATAAELVAKAHRCEASRTLTKKEVVELVASAVQNGLVSLDDLKDDMRSAVEKKLNSA